MIWFILIAGLSAVVVEALNDRHGESKKDKIRDGVLLAIYSSLICLIAWWISNVQPLKTIALVLAVRVLTFDYLINYLLIKNSVISGQWWSYTGKTAKWDHLVSKVHWIVRLALRVALFGLALWWFL